MGSDEPVTFCFRLVVGKDERMFNEPSRPRIVFECDKFRIVVRMSHGSKLSDRCFDVERPVKDALGGTSWHHVFAVTIPDGWNDAPAEKDANGVLQHLLALISKDELRVVRGTLVSQYAKEARDAS